MKFTEASLEKAFTELLGQEGFPNHLGFTITRKPEEVLIEADLQTFLLTNYANEGITVTETKSVILQLKSLSASDLYESNKTFLKMLSDGFVLKREDCNQKDIYIQLIDYSGLNKHRQSDAEQLLTIVAAAEEVYEIDNNIYKFVNQLEIVGTEKRIPDGIVYINGLPLEAFEFKSAIREEATIYNMIDLFSAENQIHCVTNFQDLISTPFQGEMNAICWTRQLIGDFSEIIKKVEPSGNIATLEEDELRDLQLSEQGQLARNILLNDLKLLQAHGASPILNVIKHYDRDDNDPFFPTDVYSFHVDRSPIATDTFLCTYYGESSEVLPNSQGEQKVLIPEIRDELKKQYSGPDEGFESYLTEHFFDLHYQAKPNARPISLGLGHLWKLAVDHPESKVPPCVHCAPKEKSGQTRLLMIC